MPDNTQTHTALRKAIQLYLQWHGAAVYGNLGGLGQIRGRADLTCCLRSKYIDIEIKTGTGVQSRFQKAQQAQVEQAGGIYIVAHSVDDVEHRLVALGLVVAGLC